MRVLAIISIVVVLFSCKKEEDRSCLKSTGVPGSKEILLDDFDKLFLGPHMAFELVQDSVCKVVVKGGENLLNLIDLSIDDEGRLNVVNNNGCNFLRDYSEIVTVEIHVKKLINVHFEGTQELNCLNQLNTDYLTFTIRDGAGKVNLDVNAIELRTLVTYGWGNFNFKGQVGYLNLNIGGNGFGSSYDMLVLDSLHAISQTTGVLKVNAEGCDFTAQNVSKGDIWYIGTPTSVTNATYGGGQLIDKN